MPPKKKKAKKAKKSAVIDEPVSREVRRRKDCIDCGSSNINFDPETEQMICQDCGLIFEELPPDMEKQYEKIELL
jgi:ribosomal protein S27E